MSDSPFKMLDSYNEKDVDRFFGREKETAQLYNAVFASNLTLLYGASGTGKTSLVDCGLRNSFYDTDWLPIFIRRGDNINKSLTTLLHQKSKRYQVNPAVAIEELKISERVANLYRDYYRPVYLVFDQFEELFISGKQEEQNEFYQTIKELLSAGLQAKVLLIFREEWIAYLNEFERVVPTLFNNRLRIERMTERQLLEVIDGTIEYEKIEVIENETPDEDHLSVIEHILANLRGDAKEVELANLQIYLDRLYRNDLARIKKGSTGRSVQFDAALVNQTNDIEDVLSDFLDEQIEKLETELQMIEEVSYQGLPMDILYQLVTDDGTKRSISVEELAEELLKNQKAKKQGVSKTIIEHCVNRFNHLRIIRIISKD